MPLRVALLFPETIAVTVMPPLGIGYLASVSEAAGFPTELFDLSRRALRPTDVSDRLRADAYDVIGVSVSTPNFRRAGSLLALIREASPRSAIVIGGPHPSAFVEGSLAELRPDFLIQKEAEHSFREFLRRLERGEDPVGRVDGVYAWRDGVAVGRPPEGFIDDLDALPWPAWEKLQPHLYPPMPHQLFVRRFPVAPILTTRGCPMECSFCASGYLFGRKIRTRRADLVVEEIRFLKERFGIREIHFEDDNLTLDRAHAAALLERIAGARLGLLFKCPNGLMTMTLDDELLGLMARAGCYQISLGIETTAPEALGREAKYLPYDDVRAVVASAHRHGIDVQGLFVIGLPYETPANVRRTVRDAIRMGIDLAHFGVFIALPGSQQGERLATCDLADANFFTPHLDSVHAGAREMKALQRWAILRFYLRPRALWKLLTLFKIRQTRWVLNTIGKYLLGF